MIAHHIHSAAHLSSFWKLWSPSSRSRKRKRGGSGGTSLSSCSILRVEMSKTTPLLLVRRRVGRELEEGEEKSEQAEGKQKGEKGSSRAMVKGLGRTDNGE